MLAYHAMQWFVETSSWRITREWPDEKFNKLLNLVPVFDPYLLSKVSAYLLSSLIIINIVFFSSSFFSFNETDFCPLNRQTSFFVLTFSLPLSHKREIIILRSLINRLIFRKKSRKWWEKMAHSYIMRNKAVQYFMKQNIIYLMSSQRIYHQKLVSIVQLILWMNKTIYKIIYKTSLANNSFYNNNSSIWKKYKASMR